MGKKRHCRTAIVHNVELQSSVRTKQNARYWTYWEDIIRPKLEFIEAWVRNGGSNKELSSLLGIPEESFCECVTIFPELYHIVQNAKFICEINIESALYQAACGYEYTEVKKEEKQNPRTGQIQMLETKTRKQMAPSIPAATLWLSQYGRNWGTAKLDRKYKKRQIELLELQIAQIKDGDNQEEQVAAYQKAFMEAMKAAAKDVWKENKDEQD